jgi:hypothetical protein
MLRCPKCNRTYENDAQKFCTRDGGRLIVVEVETPNFNPNATIVSAPPFDPNKTVVSQSQQSFDPNKTAVSQPEPVYEANKPVPSQPQTSLEPSRAEVSQPPVQESFAPPQQPPIQQPPVQPQQVSSPEIFQTLPSASVEALPDVSQPSEDEPLLVVPIEEEESFDATVPYIPPQESESQLQAQESPQKSAPPQIPMPSRYDQTSPTAADLSYTTSGAPPSQTSANYPSPTTAPPQSVEAQYASPPPIETPAQFQGGYDSSLGQTGNYGPQNFPREGGQYTGYQNASYQGFKAEPETIPAQHVSVSTPVAPRPIVVVAPPKKKSNKLLFLGLGAVFFAFLIVVIGVAGFVLVLHPEWVGLSEKQPNVNKNARNNANDNANTTNTNQTANDNANTTANTNTNTNTNTTQPPPNSTQFVNSLSGLSGDLASHFVPFSFYYPQNWTRTQAPPQNYFVQVIRNLDGFPQEGVEVGFYESKGTFEADRESFQSLVQKESSLYAKKGYEKASEGETEVNGMRGYEFNWRGQTNHATKGEVKFFGRTVFLPSGKEGEKTGIILIMYGTSLAPELQSIDDVGAKGEMPMILSTFKLGQ